MFYFCFYWYSIYLCLLIQITYCNKTQQAMNRRRATSIVQIGEVNALKNNRAERFKNNDIKTKQSRVIVIFYWIALIIIIY